MNNLQLTHSIILISIILVLGMVLAFPAHADPDPPLPPISANPPPPGPVGPSIPFIFNHIDMTPIPGIHQSSVSDVNFLN